MFGIKGDSTHRALHSSTYASGMPRPPQRARPLFEALEQRLLLNADPVTAIAALLPRDSGSAEIVPSTGTSVAAPPIVVASSPATEPLQRQIFYIDVDGAS